MDRKTKQAIIAAAKKLTDTELEQEYYEAAFACLGSEAEEMYERGYDMADIKERERYERDLGVRVGVLEGLCVERGIKLWEEAKADG